MISAVVLAAGLGSKAWPYAGSRQKVTLPVLNVPLVRSMAMNLWQAGIQDVVVVVGHCGQDVRACLSDLSYVRFAEQPRPTGTGDAALVGASLCQSDVILICYGDTITTIESILTILTTYQDEDVRAVMLGCRKAPSATIGANIEVDKTGRIQSVMYCSAAQCSRVFAGFIMLDRQLLLKGYDKMGSNITNCHGPMPRKETDILSYMNGLCEDGEEIAYADARGYVVDVDKPWQLVEANVEASRYAFSHVEDNLIGEGAFVSEKAEIATNARVILGPGARIGDYCRIQSSVILEAGARLEHGVVIRSDGGVVLGQNACAENFCGIGGRSVIGPRSYVGHGAELIGITFNDVSVRHPSQLCAVLGSGVNIAGGVMTSNWRFDNEIREQRVGAHKETPERYGEMTFIGDYVRVGNNVAFSPGTRVGSYSCVGSGIWVNEDVPDKSLLILKQEVTRRDWGPERYGW